MNLNDINSLFGGVYLPAALTRSTVISAFAKLLFAHLAQHADSHNMVQLHFPFTVSELGFLDERELIGTLDELESHALISVQRGYANQELMLVHLMPNFTDLLRLRESNNRGKRRARFNAALDSPSKANTGIPSAKRLDKPKSADNPSASPPAPEEPPTVLRTTGEPVESDLQIKLFSDHEGKSDCGANDGEVYWSQPSTGQKRKTKRREPRSRHSLQECWEFAQYQRRMNGAERIPTPDRFAVALYTTGQQDDEIELFLLTRRDYNPPASDSNSHGSIH